MDSSIDISRYANLCKYKADFMTKQAIYVLSKYDDDTKYNMLVMCLQNIKSLIQNNKDKKSEILNILQLFGSNEAFQILGSFKNNKVNSGGGSSSGRKNKSSSNSSASMMNPATSAAAATSAARLSKSEVETPS